MGPLEADPFEEAKARMLKLISSREHSRAELQRKLLARGIPADLVRRALDWAEREGYVDERRFAAAYADELRRKGYGPMVIRKKLYEKGVRGEVPAAAEAPELEDEDDGGPAAGSLERQAADLVERRFGEPEALEPAIKLKAARFLQRRGFDMGTIRAVLGPLPRS
jgi:regulatory protein